MINKLLENYSCADLYLYLKVTPEEAMNRINMRVLKENYSVSINENISCLKKLDKLYEEEIKNFKKDVFIFDTTIEQTELVFNKIINVIKERLLHEML